MENPLGNDSSRINLKTLVTGGVFAIVLLIVGVYLVNLKGEVQGFRATNVAPEPADEPLSAERQEAIAWYEMTIDKLYRRIEKTEELIIGSETELQETYQASLTELQKELETMQSELKLLRRASEAEWQMLKSKVAETRARVEEKLQNDYRDYSVSIDKTTMIC